MNRWVQGLVRTAAAWGTLFIAITWAHMQIKTLRASLRDKRRSLSPALIAEKSQAIATRVQMLPAWRLARKIGFYWPTAEEVSILPLIQLAQAESKSCYLPALNHASWRNSPLLFRPYQPNVTPLRKNRFGIAEPLGRLGSGYSGSSLDLVIVPVVGFNQACDRIGMGGGYYDRAFQGSVGSRRARQRTTLLGLAFDCQQAEFEPAPHDIPLDMIITESRRY